MRKAAFVLLGLTVALAVTAGASGTVQRLITGRDIAKNTITSGNIKDYTILRRDLNRRLAASLRGPRGVRGPVGAKGDTGAKGTTGTAGAKGTTGAKGATGAAGAPGADGSSAFDTVPAGVTISGVVGLDVDASTPGGDWGTLETMGMPGSAVLDDPDVAINIDGWTDLGGNTAPTTTDTDAGCTGSPAGPTAPAGMVCIYVLHADNAGDLFGYGVGSNQGFKLNFTSVLAGDSFVDAVWAYTG